MKKKVLVFPAGTEIGLEIYRSLRYSKFVELYGGTSCSDHSEFVYERLIADFPYINEVGFIDFLNKTIKDYEIDCVFPAHDDALVVFSENREKINAQVIVADINTVKICRSKKRTYEAIKNRSYVPYVYGSNSIPHNFPVFVKPDIGQGSKGAMKINTIEEMETALEKNSDIVITEYLPGNEYTVDCFTNGDGKLLSKKTRTRDRTINGISARSAKIQLSNVVDEIAEDLNRIFEFKGAWFFQIKEDKKGKYKLLEVSPRIPGTVGLSRNQGINYEMLTLFVFWGYEISLAENQYEIKLDRALKSLYKIDICYEYVYVDYDDTLIIDGRINTELMTFLYQCVNEKKRIILLSKHIGDICEELRNHRISGSLFDEIIVLKSGERKADYISHGNSIFIDDSFAERNEVKAHTGINVFDLDMIESLLVE